MPNVFSENHLEKATLAGGCFWCTEAIFKRLKGVTSVIPGYTGGTFENPTYKQVCDGSTGHAEAIQITFDPKIISYKTLLDVFWHTHNPTTINQQGADIGTQYRSAIFCHNYKQKEEALQSKKEAQESEVYIEPIVTEIVPFIHFYEAEEYHKNYYNANKNNPYCAFVIDPKIQKLLKEFKKKIKKEYQ